MQNRREHFRVRYPSAERPRFVFGTSISEVIECSERGVRYRTTGTIPGRGARIAGRISMRHGKEIRVSGTVVWGDQDMVALHLDQTPIPFLSVVREQLFLRNLRRVD